MEEGSVSSSNPRTGVHKDAWYLMDHSPVEDPSNDRACVPHGRDLVRSVSRRIHVWSVVNGVGFPVMGTVGKVGGIQDRADGGILPTPGRQEQPTHTFFASCSVSASSPQETLVMFTSPSLSAPSRKDEQASDWMFPRILVTVSLRWPEFEFFFVDDDGTGCSYYSTSANPHPPPSSAFWPSCTCKSLVLPYGTCRFCGTVRTVSQHGIRITYQYDLSATRRGWWRGSKFAGVSGRWSVWRGGRGGMTYRPVCTVL